jgi:hypothetical protein
VLRLFLPTLRVTKLKYDPSNLAIFVLLATAKIWGIAGILNVPTRRGSFPHSQVLVSKKPVFF